MAYISFAREERELFKLLFMRDRSQEKVEENRTEIEPQILFLDEPTLGLDLLPEVNLAGHFADILPHLYWVTGYTVVILEAAVLLFLRQMEK